VRTSSRNLPDNHPHNQARTTSDAETAYGNISAGDMLPPRRRQQRQPNELIREIEEPQQLTIHQHRPADNTMLEVEDNTSDIRRRNNKRSHGVMLVGDPLLLSSDFSTHADSQHMGGTSEQFLFVRPVDNSPEGNSSSSDQTHALPQPTTRNGRSVVQPQATSLQLEDSVVSSAIPTVGSALVVASSAESMVRTISETIPPTGTFINFLGYVN
jgi:hypothetical protein